MIPTRFTVGITGASGMVYARRLVDVLVSKRIPLYVIVSDPAKSVWHEEEGFQWHNNASAITSLWGSQALEWVTVLSNRDFSAPVSSGSHRSGGMVIVPCSMATLAAVATGLSNNLIHRAADVALKERRPLVVVPRETPLSEIHLENMLKLRRMGVSIVPAMPGFYPTSQKKSASSDISGQRSVEDLVDFVVGKTLDQMGLDHDLYKRWREPGPFPAFEGAEHA